jgi:hypothetical protein
LNFRPAPFRLRLPVGVEFSFVDCAGGAVGKDYQATPVLVKFHDANQKEAKSIYKQWKDKSQP